MNRYVPTSKTSGVSEMPGKPSLDAKMCPAKSFKINTGLCHYKGTEPNKSFSLLRRPILWMSSKALSASLPLRFEESSNVCFYFIQGIVDLCESLFDAQCC